MAVARRGVLQRCRLPARPTHTHTHTLGGEVAGGREKTGPNKAAI